MENVWKSEGECVGARLCKDFVWSEEFSGNFLGRSSHTEELDLDECVVSNLEFWSQRPLGISRGLVLTLSFDNVLPELLV